MQRHQNNHLKKKMCVYKKGENYKIDHFNHVILSRRKKPLAKKGEKEKHTKTK